MSTERRHPHVVNLDELDGMRTEKGSRFGAEVKPVGRFAGATEVGCNHFEVPPGRSAFPNHYHCAIEEAFFILEGRGRLRIGNHEIDVRAGDWVTCPAGPEHAHQLTNTGDASLRYLCISNKARADVVGYPDSNKVAAMASPSPDFFAEPWVRGVFFAEATVGYYDREDPDGDSSESKPSRPSSEL